MGSCFKKMLTEYISMCATSEKPRKYLYREFPEHYVSDKKSKCWTERIKGNVIGRIEYTSFKEAAQMSGLLEADKSIIECLNEAVTFQMPNELRKLFAVILIYCAPTEVRILWDTYFDAMSEDFIRESGTTVELRISKTLKSISFFLESMGNK